MEKAQMQQMFEMYQATGDLIESMLERIGWFHLINVLQVTATNQELPELARELENVLVNYTPEVR